jgi:hypothetical protein
MISRHVMDGLNRVPALKTHIWNDLAMYNNSFLEQPISIIHSSKSVFIFEA